MNLAIPPDTVLQAIIAILAGGVAGLLGLYLMHRAWNYRDHRSERDFILGFVVSAAGAAWIVLGIAIVLGLAADTAAAQDQVQEMVVFTNATVRCIVLILGAHVLFEAWKDYHRRAR